ncbi:uncharacterized protein [Eurosta solidaginis]|uniref:uncharacterized protein n=1 Tax=Eurosta solidaginis TaxID=178769 RepID=UPI0035308215
MYSSGTVNFLKRLNPQQIQKRITMSSAISSSDIGGSISLETPLEDYQRLIKEKVESEEIDDDDVMSNNFKAIASLAHQTVWKLLFESEFKTNEQQTKASNFLRKIKDDACFHDPYSYNNWITGVRDELLKRQMLDFWRNHMVEQELGPCWARDSDYFDDMEDPAPAAFYNFAGCVAPFGQAVGETPTSAILEIPPSTIEDASDVTSDFEANISTATPLEDYEKLVKEKVESEQLAEDDAINNNFKKIATTARDVIWKLLFAEDPASEEDTKKAGELLSRLKADACFYDPWSYNKWIGSVRDELLKRNMIDFWCSYIVGKELGPCWARDCDFFDDMDDPQPAEFYNQAGCVAPFGNKMYSSGTVNFLKRLNPQQIQKRITMSSAISSSDIGGSISLETPLEDYQRLIKEKVESEEIDDDDVMSNNFKAIASLAHQTVWKLLFESEFKTNEQQTKASNFLRKIKDDACFHDPYSYNNWITGVRDELLKRQMLDFWRNHMVEQELGPCWARDSDYFDDMEDPAPAAFYNFAGCVAPFGQAVGETPTSAILEIPPSTIEDASDVTSDFEANISTATPLEDYEKLVKEKVESEQLAEDDAINNNFKKVATTARDVIWKLLFAEDPASEEDTKKAGELLSRLKADACFYDPWSYNKWIGSVRDELLKRNMIDFWCSYIVGKELGPCWARDCDFFDDMDDPQPAEFYNQAGCVAPFGNK